MKTFGPSLLTDFRPTSNSEAVYKQKFGNNYDYRMDLNKNGDKVLLKERERALGRMKGMYDFSQVKWMAADGSIQAAAVPNSNSNVKNSQNTQKLRPANANVNANAGGPAGDLGFGPMSGPGCTSSNAATAAGNKTGVAANKALRTAASDYKSLREKTTATGGNWAQNAKNKMYLLL